MYEEGDIFKRKKLSAIRYIGPINPKNKPLFYLCHFTTCLASRHGDTDWRRLDWLVKLTWAFLNKNLF